MGEDCRMKRKRFIMKPNLAVVFLSLSALLAIPMVGHAATFDPVVTGGSTGTSKATIEMTDDARLMTQIVSAPDVAFSNQFADGRVRNGLNASKVTDPLAVKSSVPTVWTVQVATSGLKTTDGTEMTGAQLHFAPGKVSNSGNFSIVASSPASQQVDLSGTPTTIFNAPDAKQNGGTWSVNYQNTDVTMDVPATAVAGTYSADLTWTITCTPGQST